MRQVLGSGQRDLLFLFHLHYQANERFAYKEKELRWRILYLGDGNGAWNSSGKRPPRAKDKGVGLSTSREQAAALREDVLALLGASTLLSRRYFSGEELLYPRARATLLELLATLHILRRLDLLTFGTRRTGSSRGQPR